VTQAIRQVILDLQSQHKHYLDQAARLTRAIEALRLANTGTPAAKAAGKPTQRKKTAAVQRPAKLAKPAKKANGKLSLSKALAYVLGEYRKAGAASATAQQLIGDIGKAGFRFGGRNPANNMNYLCKTLRTNKAFKRAGTGKYALA
jgi:hypothetical protein